MFNKPSCFGQYSGGGFLGCPQCSFLFSCNKKSKTRSAVNNSTVIVSNGTLGTVDVTVKINPTPMNAGLVNGSVKKQAYILMIIPGKAGPSDLSNIQKIEKDTDLEYQRQNYFLDLWFQSFAQRYEYDDFKEIWEEVTRLRSFITGPPEDFCGIWAFNLKGELHYSDGTMAPVGQANFDPGRTGARSMYLTKSVLEQLIPGFGEVQTI